jgi:hypothetical protein
MRAVRLSAARCHADAVFVRALPREDERAARDVAGGARAAAATPPIAAIVIFRHFSPPLIIDTTDAIIFFSHFATIFSFSSCHFHAFERHFRCHFEIRHRFR